ncbi:hypothetical protein ACFVU3_29120 [Streptomyces sp. NPDC058052]|uniref:hypothetical protein n=1 Tax=Streptomyces sp. NPDC058052 TaxID=3346316 RepID=UPI0036ECFA3A
MNFIRERRRAFLLLLSVAFLLGFAAVSGRASAGQGGLVWLSWPREHVSLLAGATLIVLAAAALWGLTKSPLRTALVILLLFLGLPMAWLAMISASYSSGERELKAQDAPGRDDRRMILVHYDSFDPASCLYVHQDSPLGERAWQVACFMGEEGDAIRDAVWTSPERVRMTVATGATTGESHEVAILPSGQPEKVLLYGSQICPGDMRGDCQDP